MLTDVDRTDFTPRSESRPDLGVLRADDETRTRDIHLGKVVTGVRLAKRSA